MTDTTAATALSWPTLPPICPVCRGALPYPDDSQGHLSKRYQCGQLLWLIGEQWELAVDESCREASRLAVAQRQRAEDAERDYAVLLADYNAAAAWLGVLESGDDLEVAAKSLTDQLSDVLQRADALQQQIADLTGAEFDHTVATAEHYLNIGQAERDELKARADAAEAELAEQHERGDKYSLGWINETKRADALAGQVERLTKALESAREYLRHEEGCNYPYGAVYGCKCGLLTTLPEIDAALLPAPGTLADLRGSVPDNGVPSEVAIANLRAEWDDPNAPSLDDFTHWPFPPEG